MIKLENETLTVTILTKGAELTSIKRKDNKIEYLWQADPKYWGRHAPVLFPFVGRLKEDRYEVDGKTYPMGQHGFARDCEFEIMHQTASTVTLKLSDSPSTKERYPYAFHLLITYTLADNTVTTAYRVENPASDKSLYFSIGAHPGFNIPLTTDTIFEDYYFSFSPRKTRTTIPLSGAYLNTPCKTLAQTNTDIALTRSLFDNDAMIYETKGENIFTIKSEKTEHSVAVRFVDFPYVGIWSPPQTDAPFVCIEPWFGIADDMNATGKIEEKLGMQTLAPQKSFEAAFEITVN
ncbi:aldose 1-epimerase family protein [Carnobacterium divergens]|nr:MULTISPECIES: aldose 1-epimerase family protein [Carnobacterium]MCO6017773.1 aldose 1-epimerase family protein [Carnobacterium divergens]MDT1938871.1 aldose 1-epimerase family protein [Carnobacterium divergens]MDT1941309.1 aldose 1-epimerase family protein [Carnobacterium divergens]MDT1947107.1 aldose 1-epimerase family protein [Carnobacterium divergens]MDT1949545.1 aldose 1-epimerase family protein [Carnobacterium divergens]